MEESGYREYKKNLSRSRNRREGLRRGRLRFILGICFLLYTLFLLPFRAGSVGALRGEAVTAGEKYYPEKVYSIENLRLLRAKVDAGAPICCIAEFTDMDGHGWVVSFTPGRNQQLAEQIGAASSSDGELTLTASGYFLLQSMEDMPPAADAFYTVYGAGYADTDGHDLLGLNAEYLCEFGSNYTLQALLRPGIPLISFLLGISGILSGGLLIVRNRFRRGS